MTGIMVWVMSFGNAKEVHRVTVYEISFKMYDSGIMNKLCVNRKFEVFI